MEYVSKEKKILLYRIIFIFLTLILFTIVSNNLDICYAAKFGVYSETIPGCILYDAPLAECRIGTYNSSGSSILLSSDNKDKMEGNECLKAEADVISGGWVGWFVQWGVEWENENITVDMSKYSNGYLIFWIKTPIELQIGIRSCNISPGSEKSKVYISDYCSIDNQWHEVSIPLSDFKNKETRLDFTKIKILFNAARVGSTGGIVNFWIDNVRWTSFEVESITPNKAYNIGTISITIDGEGFETGAEIKIINTDDLSTISGTNTLVVSSEQITTDFDLSGASETKWDVEVKNPDARTVLLKEGFETKKIKSQSKGSVQISGRKVLLHGSSYIIKGIGYSPTPIGASPELGWRLPDSNSPEIKKGIYDRDFSLLKQMNCNTIRTWGKVTDTLLEKAEEYNLKVICGFWIDYNLNLEDTNIRNNIKEDFKTYITNYKDANAVLMWSIGNEQNYQNGNNSQWYSLINEMSKVAYELEGNIYHPVTTPNGELNNIGDPNMDADDISMNYLDLWGANVYRGYSFGNLFIQYETKSFKPFWISEYGIDSWDHIEDKENQEEQAIYASDLWDEIVTNHNICVGGTIMAYSDEWWKNDNITSHEPGGFELSSFPDGWSDEEYWGIIWIEDNGENPDIIHTKVVYYTIQAKWSVAPLPVIESINPRTTSNLGNVQITIKGNYFQADPNVMLIKNGLKIYSSETVVQSPKELEAKFNFNQNHLGTWDVKVINSDKKTGILSDAFTISIYTLPQKTDNGDCFISNF